MRVLMIGSTLITSYDINYQTALLAWRQRISRSRISNGRSLQTSRRSHGWVGRVHSIDLWL